jgi:hypothetical protein
MGEINATIPKEHVICYILQTALEASYYGISAHQRTTSEYISKYEIFILILYY